jgi:kynurenine formamidase
MLRYTWLSYPLDIRGPRPPAIPAPELSDLYTVAKDGASVQILRVASHTGTHLDTPCHVIAGGVQITEFAPQELIFTRPVVVDLHLADAEIVQPAHLQPHARPLGAADIALFRFGYGKVRASDPQRFGSQCPGFGVESVHWLRANCPQLRAMGMDVPSVATIAHLDETMRCHNVLLDGAGRRFLIVEEMNLDQDLSALCEVRVNPWLVRGMDSGPCTIVGVLKQPTLQ